MDGNFNFHQQQQFFTFGNNPGFQSMHRTEFVEFYRCFPISSFVSIDRKPLDYAGKIIMPQSALAKLAALHIEYPMLFELECEHSEKFTHGGVLEFTAPEGKCFVPSWMMEQIDANNGDIIKITSTTLQKGTFLKIQPQSVDFLDITDPKAVLENALRQYSALTEGFPTDPEILIIGDIITIYYNNKVYKLLCMELKPELSIVGRKAISIFETDLSVDFAPPVGYVEPDYKAQQQQQQQIHKRSLHNAHHALDIEQHKIEDDDKWKAFSGSGKRLSGKPSSAKSAIPSTTTDKSSSKESHNEKVRALRLPSNKLWFGYPAVAPPPSPEDDAKDKKKTVGSGFSGEGNKLRKQK